MLGVKGALSVHFEFALNLTSQNQSVFATKSKSRVVEQHLTQEETTRLLRWSQ